METFLLGGHWPLRVYLLYTYMLLGNYLVCTFKKSIIILAANEAKWHCNHLQALEKVCSLKGFNPCKVPLMWVLSMQRQMLIATLSCGLWRVNYLIFTCLCEPTVRVLCSEVFARKIGCIIRTESWFSAKDIFIWDHPDFNESFCHSGR